MQQWRIDPAAGFHVLGGTPRSEAATMVLEAGETTGGPENTHEGDQWLFVLKGRGRAIVSGEPLDLQPGTLIVIEGGEPHQVENTGNRPLETLNFYTPPEY